MILLRAFASLLCCFAILIGGGMSVRAHPHVWATMQTEIQVNAARQITGFLHKWTFDEFYSSFAVEGLDTNNDGVYSEEELKPLADTNVDALQEFDYFTYAMLGETKLKLKKPTKYHLEHKNNLLTLYFELPLEKPLPLAQAKRFSFTIYDPSYYIAMAFNDKTPTPVTITSPKPVPCQVVLGGRTPPKESTLAQAGENIDPSSMFGAQFAQKVTVECKGW